MDMDVCSIALVQECSSRNAYGMCNELVASRLCTTKRLHQQSRSHHLFAGDDGQAKQAQILQEARRTPERKEDATATWSLTLLQRTLRQASNGLPKVSTFTILPTLHEAGYSWQKNRTWCHTGSTLKKGKDGTVNQSEDPYAQEKNGD